jgi:hypothetical protein
MTVPGAQFDHRARAGRHLGAAGAGLLFLLAACGSSGTAAAGEREPPQAGRPAVTGKPMRIAFRDFRSGQDLELVNESHTAPTELYSTILTSAVRKVQTDEVVEALYDYLEEKGFESHARSGAIPAAQDGQAIAGLEVEDGRGRRHWLATRAQDKAEKTAVFECAKAFVDTYNLTYALQAVKLAPGEDPFQNPVGKTKQLEAKPVYQLEGKPKNPPPPRGD